MKHTALALCLSLTLTSLSAFATDSSAAPSLTTAQLQTIHWQPTTIGATQEFDLTSAGQTATFADASGKFLALQLPADHGALTIRVRSLIEGKQVFAPNVLVLDQQQRPAAFYPSNQFSYQPASLLTGDRLESTLKLSPAPGQKNIYLLVYTTPRDLQQQTVLQGASKAYAKATGNQPPDIPDPVAQHTNSGQLSLKISAERTNDTISIGNNDTTAIATPLTAASAPTEKMATTAALLPATENYFNQQIRQALKAGDLSQALTLLQEAERLGSSSARTTFMDNVQPRH
ncbi:maltose operon protein MalM [uncultured Tolumonas sp.]|uniref:maltose operon protein MalM n=1 Tax=uncultured Tolumonas sp. TaxID=263765 RepID=UPI00292F3E5B|nr:maltose operon protein MalM [uncultured Tolumonas sp.]